MEGELYNVQEGLEGELGYKGERGYSTYELAVLNGFEGSLQDYLDHYGVDLSNYISTNDVVDNLTSTTTNYPLSANQGKVLKGMIDDNTTFINTKANSSDVYTKTESNNLYQPKVLSGTSDPSSSLGNDGDLYFQYES